MLNRSKYLMLALLAIAGPLQLLAQDNTPKYSNEFLSLGVGARYMAMGSTGVSFADDVSAGYWNPAGLLSIASDHQLILMHAAYFAGIANYDFGAFATRLQDSSRIGLSIIRFSVDDIPDTRFLFDANGAIDYSRIRFFSAADNALLLTYARKVPFLGGFDFGGSVKIIHRKVGNFSRAWGFGLDLGGMRSFGGWDVGISGRDIFGTFNAWSHNADEFRESFNATGNDIPVNTVEVTLPRLILGVSRRFDPHENFSVLANTELVMTFDGRRNTYVKTDLISIDPIASLEIGFKDMVFLRGGAGQFQRINNLAGTRVWRYQPTMGIGIVIRELSVDYALTDVGDQAEGLYSHVFSIKADLYAGEK